MVCVDSWMEAEGIASYKAAEGVSYAREILRAIGVPLEGPTLVGTDNLANMRVGTLRSAPSLARATHLPCADTTRSSSALPPAKSPSATSAQNTWRPIF